MSARIAASRVTSLPDGGEVVPVRDVDWYVHRLPAGATQTQPWSGPLTRAAAIARRDAERAAIAAGDAAPVQWLVVKVTTVTEVIV